MTTSRLILAGILVLALFALPHAVEAQQARVYRVGVVLLEGPHSAAIDGLRDGLRELGLEEGKQFVLHVREVKGDLKSVETAARSIEGEKVDLIVAISTSVTLAAKRATKSVPIVFGARAKRLPTIVRERGSVAKGALAAYGESFYTIGRLAAKYDLWRGMSGDTPRQDG